MANFPYCALCLSNFAFAGARPWRSAALAPWPADLVRSSFPVLLPKVHLPLLKPAQALARLKSPPRGRNRSPEFLWPPEVTSPPLSPLCLWIHGLFPAIDFAVAPSSPLPNFSDPKATLARASLSSGDLTAMERSDAARSHLFSLGLISLRPIQIKRLRPARTPLGPARTRSDPLWTPFIRS
jgi:hypothetical protein